VAWQGEPGVAQVLASEVLADEIEPLDPFSQAALALALYAGGDDITAILLVDGLVEIAVEGEQEAFWSTAIPDGSCHDRTEDPSVRSAALALEALVKIDPQSPLIPKVARWLMTRRLGGAWSTPQETCYALLALADYASSRTVQVEP
jgi:hypothetical protein